MTSAKPDQGAAQVIAALLKAHAGLDLPVRLRTWDGSEAGPRGAPAPVARSPRALRRILWHPGQLGLARAYISGDLDVEGDLTDGLRRVWTATRPRGPARQACMWWGLFLISLGSWVELPFVFAPLLMTYILTRGTGQRMTDRRMTASRPQYADYVARTSGFIPLPPKRSAAARARPGTAAGRSGPPANRTRRRWRGGRAARPGR
jgi:Protein of unknown function (DUF1295)